MTRRNDPGNQSRLLVGADLLTGGQMLPSTAVLLQGGKVLALGKAAERMGQAHGAKRVDLSDHYLSPGFIDLHTHGVAGVDFVTASREDFRRAMSYYLRRGVTSLLVSLYPSSFKESLRVLERVSGYLRDRVGEGVAVGIHLEGPFLSPRWPGALPKRHFRTFRAADVNALIDAGRGFVRTMTLAPEQPGGLALVEHLLKRRVIPAFGHSNADYEETKRSLERGIRYATHLFNAMRGIHHRAPGAATALLEDSKIAVELIADGLHIDIPVLKLVHALKPREQVVLVSDSVHPCGLKPGRYEFAGGPVDVRNGKVTRPDGTLAGSILTLDRAVSLHVKRVGLSPQESVMLATKNPARILGLERSHGAIQKGGRADLVVLDRALRVRATWLSGKQVYGSPV